MHCLVHAPARSDCLDCARAKSRRKKWSKGSFKREAREFGDLVTIDHVEMKRALDSRGLDGNVAALTLLDVATVL